MAIISASRRTDIPAFYGDWLINRLKAGFCLVKNPFRPDQVRRVDLSPSGLDGLVFWTRRPAPFFKHLSELSRLAPACYFQMTLTGMGQNLEPGLPPTLALIDQFVELSGLVGPERLVWRFDPILVSRVTPPDEIQTRFTGLADRLAGKCRRVIVSRTQFYAKTKRRLGKILDLKPIDLFENDQLSEDILGGLSQAAVRRGFEITICSDGNDYSALGSGPARCIDPEIFNKADGLDLVYSKDKGQRKECCCAEAIDIGAYNSCTHGCRYCYAVTSRKSALANLKRHDPMAESLLP